MRNRKLAIGTMFALYGLVAFVTTLAAPLATVWKARPEMAGSNALAMLGNLMNYLAYFLMGIPAGRILGRWGYKRTAVAGCATGFAGMALQWAGGMGEGSFGTYLAGALTSGVALCLLNVVINPVLNELGGGGAGGNRLNMLGGSINSLCGALTPLLVGALIGKVTAETRLADVNAVLWVAMGTFAAGAAALAAMPLPGGAPGGGGGAGRVGAWEPLKFAHCRWGILGIFLFMGTSIGIAGTLNLWLIGQGHSPVTGGFFFSAYVMLMLAGRLTLGAVAHRIPVRAMLGGASAAAMALVGAAMAGAGVEVWFPALTEGGAGMVRVTLAAPLLVACGFCTSVMWSSIFALSVEDLGEATPAASGLFMMMVVGGGVIPLVQNWLADAWGYRASFAVPLGVFGYLIWYAAKLTLRKEEKR